ncbi:1-acyl-sn-glycerol-3-phosphate acyltransferase epsilon, partial [Ophiophagus hannah]
VSAAPNGGRKGERLSEGERLRRRLPEGEGVRDLRPAATRARPCCFHLGSGAPGHEKERRRLSAAARGAEAKSRPVPRAPGGGEKMLLSLLLHTYSLRYVLPTAVMLGTAPTYILAWGAWRLLSTLLPARFYHQVDDRLYTIYQSMVLFFFEHYTGVQVRQGGSRAVLKLGHSVLPLVPASPPSPSQR